MSIEWTFEGDERNDMLRAINLLCNSEDADRRQIYADLRDNQIREWDCRLEFAREFHRREKP